MRITISREMVLCTFTKNSFYHHRPTEIKRGSNFRDVIIARAIVSACLNQDSYLTSL